MPDSFLPYIDLESGLNRVRGNTALYRKLLSLFLESREFDALEDALQASDYPKAAELAHAIKGMTGNLSLNSIFACSAELMLQLRQGAPEESALAAYRDSFEKTKAAVIALAARLDAEASV